MDWTHSSNYPRNTGRNGQKNVGKKQVLDLANSEWNRINQSHGWVARIQHAVQQVVLVVHDVREQWNLLAAYELYTGTLLKVPDLVFMPGELERDKPEIWVKRLDQYRVAYMKLLSGKRQKVENPDAGGGSPGAQGATQAGTVEIVDSSSMTPEKQIIGAGGNEGAGATPPQNLPGGTDVPMEEDGTTTGMELLSLPEEPLGLIGITCAGSGNEKEPRSGCVWLGRWSGIPIAGFYVPSVRNPADPPSRMHDFDSLSSCLGLARERYWQWHSSPFPYQDYH